MAGRPLEGDGLHRRNVLPQAAGQIANGINGGGVQPAEALLGPQRWSMHSTTETQKIPPSSVLMFTIDRDLYRQIQVQQQNQLRAIRNPRAPPVPLAGPALQVVADDNYGLGFLGYGHQHLNAGKADLQDMQERLRLLAKQRQGDAQEGVLDQIPEHMAQKQALRDVLDFNDPFLDLMFQGHEHEHGMPGFNLGDLEQWVYPELLDAGGQGGQADMFRPAPLENAEPLAGGPHVALPPGPVPHRGRAGVAALPRRRPPPDAEGNPAHSG